MKLIEEQPASKELEVPVYKELTSKKVENFMIKDAEHGLGETKKKRKNTARDMPIELGFAATNHRAQERREQKATRTRG